MLKGLKSLLVGLAAGTALGVLFAPKKGQEIRKDLKKEIEKGGTGLGTLKQTAEVMGKEIKGSSTNFVNKNVPKEAIVKGKALYGKAKKHVKEIIKNAKEQ